MSMTVVGKNVVDTQTGELIPLVYEVFSSVVSAEDKRMYSATQRTAHDCTDPDQLADVMKYTTDQRGLKVKSDLTWFKKENDYRVRTLKQKALISNTQYAFLKQLVDCITYKNIILCKRSFLCAKLSIDDKSLARKLKQVEQWVQVQDCKKGFIKLFVAPLLGYKGRASGIPSANKTYYKVDPQTQYNALYIPFVGPPAPYTGPVFDITEKFKGAEWYEDDRCDSAMGEKENFTSGDWWNKPAKKHEVIDVGFEAWFANNVGKDISEYHVPALEVWEPDYINMPCFGAEYYQGWQQS